jgi:exopolysaccharide production protein ExoZ
MADANETKVARIEALDSLRFLAASAVMITHFHAVASSTEGAANILPGLLDARAAVVLFFILSGLVLHMNWAGERPQMTSTFKFYLRRWFRIYPLYYAALGLTLILTQTLPLPDCNLLSSWDATAHVLKADHRDSWQWIQHLALVSFGIDTSFILPPVWTLVEEMRISLVFPWLSWFVARLHRHVGFGVIMLSLALTPWAGGFLISTAGIIPLFALGAWVAEYHRKQPALHAGWLWGIALAGLALYSSAGHFHWRLHQSAMGIGSAMMIFSILQGSRLKGLLSHPLLALGGRCSYGIYILHFPILMAVAWWIQNQGYSTQMLYVIGIPLSLALALSLHFCVEMPMISIGRSITKRINV